MFRDGGEKSRVADSNYRLEVVTRREAKLILLLPYGLVTVLFVCMYYFYYYLSIHLSCVSLSDDVILKEGLLSCW